MGMCRRDEIASKYCASGSGPCYLRDRTPDLDVFNYIFADRGIKFTDVDGMVESSGYLCFAEMKSDPSVQVVGQRDALLAMINQVKMSDAQCRGNLVLWLYGDSRSMSISSVKVGWAGNIYSRNMNLDQTRASVLLWKEKAAMSNFDGFQELLTSDSLEYGSFDRSGALMDLA